jgi:hypothetical protein
MAEQERPKKPQIILKRQVVTKAIVTPKFKEFLSFELNENLAFYKNKLNEIASQLKQINESHPQFAQLHAEKTEAEQYIQSEKSQQEFIENLQLDTEYSQGPVDGFVTVSTGDNLYEKLGGIEILVKDGIIIKIRSSASQFSKVTK